MKQDKELLRAIEIYNETKDDSIVKAHYNALSKIIECERNEENNPKKEYIGCSKKFFYFLELPFERLEMLNHGEYGFKKHGYNVIRKKEKNSKYPSLNYCRSLCNETREDMIKLIEERINEDNLESQK